MPPSKQEIRAELRRQRQSLSASRQAGAARSLATIVSTRFFFMRSRRLAFYLANDGELDPDFLMGLALACGKSVYLPVLDPLGTNRMHFLPFNRGDKLAVNRYGIPEPRLGTARMMPCWAMDVVFLPLVAFDRTGRRLGMGAGFYDRTLAHCRHGKARGPFLVGLAHSLQEVEQLPADSWDIPLHAIATEKQLLLI